MIRKEADVKRGVMGTLVGVVATSAIALAVHASDDKKTPPTTGEKKPAATQFKSSKDRASFAIGLNIGRTILQDFGRADAIDADQFLKGLKAGLANDQSMDRVEIREAIVEYRNDAIKQDAAKFLEENKKKEGVKVTTSGLQYQVIKSGDAKGKTAPAGGTVRAHYTGTLINGTKFDSSVDRAEPLEFKVKPADAQGPGVIQGWVEGLQLMKVGDKFRLFVPPDLGYGAKGSPPAVPPHAVLIFEVELLEIKG